MVGGFVLDQMVTNFFVLNFLRTILVGGILDLLIKSHSPRLFMPVALFCLVLSDKGFVANDTIRYRITLNNCDHFVTIWALATCRLRNYILQPHL